MAKKSKSKFSYEKRVVIVDGEGDKANPPRLLNPANGHLELIDDYPDKLLFREVVKLMADRTCSVDDACLVVLRGGFQKFDAKVIAALLKIGPPGGGSPCGDPKGDPSPRGRFLNLATTLYKSAGEFFFSVWAESCLTDALVTNVTYEITADGGVTLEVVGAGGPSTKLSLTAGDIPKRSATSTNSANNQPRALRGIFPQGFAQTTLTLAITVDGKSTTSSSDWFKPPTTFSTTVNVV